MVGPKERGLDECGHFGSTEPAGGVHVGGDRGKAYPIGRRHNSGGGRLLCEQSPNFWPYWPVNNVRNMLSIKELTPASATRTYKLAVNRLTAREESERSESAALVAPLIPVNHFRPWSGRKRED